MERGPIVFPYRLPVNWYYVADKVVLLHHAPSKRATVTPEFSERAVRFTLETSSEDLGGDEKSANAVVRGTRSMGEVARRATQKVRTGLTVPPSETGHTGHRGPSVYLGRHPTARQIVQRNVPP